MRRWTTLLAAALAFASGLAADIDGDGYHAEDDCDDRDETVWSLPGELENLHFVSRTTFVWDTAADIGASPRYVTLRSNSPSSFAVAPPASCSDTEGVTASTTDPDIPPPGTAFHYLVRARNACGDGPLGHHSNGTPTAGLACNCAALCDDAQACTRDRCSDGACVHDPITTAIADQPDDAAVCPGDDATFRVRGVPDGATHHYQWKKNGQSVGTDSPSLTLTGLSAADDDAQVTVVVTGACAPTTSSTAVVTVFPSVASCAGGGSGYGAPNGASDVVTLGDPDEPSAGSPRDYGAVQLATGEFRLEAVDLAVPGRGFDFVWERTYTSRNGTVTPLGHHWDYGYNRRIAAAGGAVTLQAGDGRIDVYSPGPTGCYTSPGFFRELCPQPDDTWVLTFPDKTTWRFAPLDGSPGQGRILAVQDTDLNTMTFSYDSSGNLGTITDTLGRPFTVDYDPAGYISSVTGFGGRHVVYERYGPLDQAGMPGDLKSVTSPPIAGTPNGNDLPEGRRTHYTYMANTGEPALDRNLVTVSKWFRLDNNAEPQVIVENVYNDADRLEKQVYADDPFTRVSYVYATPPPGEEPGAVTMTIVRDRVGNVGQVYFDSSNRAVAVRRFTGHAPSLTLPTDATTNRPVAPLRANDPPFYRTAFAWNSDSLLTDAVFPKLDSVEYIYDSSNTNVRLRANLLEARRHPGPAGGDQPLQTKRWTYAPGFGTEPNGLCVEVDGGVWRLDPVDFTTGDARRASGLCVEVDGGVWRLDPVDFTTGDAKHHSLGQREWEDITRRASLDPPPSSPISWSNLNHPQTLLTSLLRSPRRRSMGSGPAWVSFLDSNGRTYTQTVDAPTGHVTGRTMPDVNFGQPPGMPQIITATWTYNAFGQATSYTDPLGHVTQATYYSSGPARGYLESVTVDAPTGTPGALALLTITTRDAYGNLVARTDPNGDTETFAYNQLDELVRHVTPSPSSYTTDLRYDPAGRLVRIDKDNRDETGAPRPRPRVFTVVGHDPLNRPAFVTVDGPGALDLDGGLNLRTEMTHAANGWMTLVKRRNAVAGSQPHETTTILYDERSLPYRIVDAEGDPAQSTVQLDYDLDGGLAAIHEGLESSPRVTTITRDGYGRRTESTDPMGNVATWHYDSNGNEVSHRIDGELIDGASGPNVRLSESTMVYDEVGRLVKRDTAFFDTDTGTSISDGSVTWKCLHDARSQVVRVENDGGAASILSYDGAGRLASAEDALGNSVEYGHDGNGNVLTVTATDVSTSPTVPAEVTVTTSTYDEFGSIQSESVGGNVHTFLWDSCRDMPAVVQDARSNTIRHGRDDACRHDATHRTMTDTGTGSGTLAWVLDATISRDDEGRVVSQTDDAGNTTNYDYDAKGRMMSIAYADGRSETFVYDVHDDLVSWTDPNGTVVTSTYDALGRVATRSVARAPGVLGTTAEVWKHDGLSRVVHAQNDDALVTRGYDSMSHVTRETSAIAGEPGKNTNWIFEGGGALLSQTYPSGHNMGMAHDPVGRWDEMTSTGPGVCSGGPPPHAFCASAAECGGSACVPMPSVTTTYDYLGPDKVMRRVNGNGTDTVVFYDALSRVERITTQVPAGPVLDDRTFFWDADSNKTMRQVISSPGTSRHLYTYDSASRMTRSDAFIPGQPPARIDYELDGANNRVSVTGGLEAGSYTMSSTLPEPADDQMNQYTSTPIDAARSYDPNGNLVSRASGASMLAYDYRNRLVLVSGSLGEGSYAYDAFGRRVLVDGNRLYYDGTREIEERSPFGALLRLNVYGARGELLMTVAHVDQDGLPDRVFHQTDDLGNVVLAMDETGAALERYDYTDFGRPRIMSGAGAPLPVSAIGNPFFFGSRRYDVSTGLYDAVTRHLDPRAGRFVSRDALGVWGDPASLGNATAYAGNNPWSWTDPTGMAIETRDTLKTYFETGNIPTENDFFAARVPRDVLKSFFQTGDKPTAQQFSNTLDSFFQKGDKPTEAQFSNTLDSLVNFVDDRDLLGLRSYDDEVVKTFSWTQTGGPFKFSTRSGELLSVLPQAARYNKPPRWICETGRAGPRCTAAEYFLDPQNKPRQTICVTEITRDGCTAGSK